MESTAIATRREAHRPMERIGGFMQSRYASLGRVLIPYWPGGLHGNRRRRRVKT